MQKQEVVVSMTSFPAAIPYAVKAVGYILRGSVLPDKIVLYLDTQKFPDGVLPQELEALRAERVRLTDLLGHRKGESGRPDITSAIEWEGV